MTKYTYNFPKSMGGGKVTIQELSAEETLNLMDAYATKPGRLMDEMVKMSIIELDGKTLVGADKEVAWSKLSPKKRTLISNAVANISTPTQDEEASFFSSMETQVE